MVALEHAQAKAAYTYYYPTLMFVHRSWQEKAKTWGHCVPTSLVAPCSLYKILCVTYLIAPAGKWPSCSRTKGPFPSCGYWSGVVDNVVLIPLTQLKRLKIKEEINDQAVVVLEQAPFFEIMFYYFIIENISVYFSNQSHCLVLSMVRQMKNILQEESSNNSDATQTIYDDHPARF